MLRLLTSQRSVRDQLMHDAEVGTWRYDPDTEMYYFSSELALGHSGISKPVPLSTLMFIQHPDDQAKDGAIRDRLTTSGGSADGEMRYRDGQGGWKTLRVHYRSGRKLPSGKFEMFGISQNVTELATARDQADLAMERLNLAMAAGNAGVYEIDTLTGSRWSSDQFRQLAGPEAMERQRNHPFGLYMEEEHARVRASWERCLASGKVESMEVASFGIKSTPTKSIKPKIPVFGIPTGFDMTASAISIETFCSIAALTPACIQNTPKRFAINPGVSWHFTTPFPRFTSQKCATSAIMSERVFGDVTSSSNFI